MFLVTCLRVLWGFGGAMAGPANSCRPPAEKWLRGLDLNQRPLGYEPNELPGCSTPQVLIRGFWLGCQPRGGNSLKLLGLAEHGSGDERPLFVLAAAETVDVRGWGLHGTRRARTVADDDGVVLAHMVGHVASPFQIVRH